MPAPVWFDFLALVLAPHLFWHLNCYTLGPHVLFKLLHHTGSLWSSCDWLARGVLPLLQLLLVHELQSHSINSWCYSLNAAHCASNFKLTSSKIITQSAFVLTTLLGLVMLVHLIIPLIIFVARPLMKIHSFAPVAVFKKLQESCITGWHLPFQLAQLSQPQQKFPPSPS